MNHEDGYRYVNACGRNRNNPAWALYEVKGGRARRVGTAHTENEYCAFLGVPPVSPLFKLLINFDPFFYEPSLAGGAQ